MSSFFPPKTSWPRNFMYFHCLFSKFRGVKSEYVSPPRVLCFMEQATFTEEPVPKCLAEKQVTSAVLLRSPWLFSIITSRHPTQLNVFKHVRFCGPRWFFSDTCTATIVNPKNPSFFGSIISAENSFLLLCAGGSDSHWCGCVNKPPKPRRSGEAETRSTRMSGLSLLAAGTSAAEVCAGMLLPLKLFRRPPKKQGASRQVSQNRNCLRTPFGLGSSKFPFCAIIFIQKHPFGWPSNLPIWALSSLNPFSWTVPKRHL